MTDQTNRPPFETFKFATCRGCYALGTACGHCEKCDWEKSRLAPSSTPPSSAPETSDFATIANECGTPATIGATLMTCENHAGHDGPCWYHVPTPEVVEDQGDDARPVVGMGMSRALERALTEPLARNLSVRACNALLNAGLRTRAEVAELLDGDPDALLRVNDCGPRIADFIKSRLASSSTATPPDAPEPTATHLATLQEMDDFLTDRRDAVINPENYSIWRSAIRWAISRLAISPQAVTTMTDLSAAVAIEVARRYEMASSYPDSEELMSWIRAALTSSSPVPAEAPSERVKHILACMVNYAGKNMVKRAGGWFAADVHLKREDVEVLREFLLSVHAAARRAARSTPTEATND